MSTSHKKPFKAPKAGQERLQPCWEILGCSRILCPAQRETEIPCWRLPNTRCKEHGKLDYFSKLEHCLCCPVFKVYAESGPRGWSHFVSREVTHFTEDMIKLAFQKEAGFLEILNRLPDGLFTTDDEWRINYFNPTAEEITGFSAYDAIGMYCKDVFKNTICETDCALKRAVQMGKNISNREYVITNIEGKKIPIICSTSVLRDQHGRVIGGVEVFKDITDRKRLESDLKRSEKKYRRIFESSKDMIYITSKEGFFKDVNHAGVELLGYDSKEELLSLASVEKVYFNPSDRKIFQRQIEKQGFVKDFEVDFKKKDGTRIHCLLTSNVIRDQNGEVVGYEGIIKDITARTQAELTLRQRNRELSLLNAVAVAMNLTQDLDDILMIALKKVLDVLCLTSGGIFVIDQSKRSLVLRVQEGLPRSALGKRNQILLHDQALMRSLLQENLSLTPEPIFPPFKGTFKGKDPSESVKLTCFLITAKEKASGFLALDIPPGRMLTGQEVHLLGSLVNFLGGAIENTRLLQTIHQHREELKSLTAKLFQSQELERRRIARELHDEAGQALTGINFTLETIEKSLSSKMGDIKTHIADIKKQINRTYQEMRRLSYSLHPALLSDLGLEPALDTYLSHISSHSGLDIDFKMVGFEDRLDPEIETVLYRLSQEALTNTLKHSGAEKFKLSIIKSYPHIIFLAEDDGVGFDPNGFEEHKRALGLLGMRERAAMLGGKFMLRSSKGEGTRIRIELPLKESCRERPYHHHRAG